MGLIEGDCLLCNVPLWIKTYGSNKFPFGGSLTPSYISTHGDKDGGFKLASGYWLLGFIGKTNSREVLCCEMTLQNATIRWFDDMPAGCSGNENEFAQPRRSPIYTTRFEYRMDLAEERVIRTDFCARFCPSLPLVRKHSRDKVFAIWCSCCQSAVCPLHLRAKPLRVLGDESDSLVPYFMQDFLLILILAPRTVFMYKCRNFSCGRLLQQLKLWERNEDHHLSPYGLFRRWCDVWREETWEFELAAQMRNTLTQLLWLTHDETLRTAFSWMTSFDHHPPFLSFAAKQHLQTSRWWQELIFSICLLDFSVSVAEKAYFCRKTIFP